MESRCDGVLCFVAVSFYSVSVKMSRVFTAEAQQLVLLRPFMSVCSREQDVWTVFVF